MDPVTLALMKSRIASAADDWLSENVDPETGYVLDRTLAMENAAAPADLVGSLCTSITNAQIDALFS